MSKPDIPTNLILKFWWSYVWRLGLSVSLLAVIASVASGLIAGQFFPTEGMGLGSPEVQNSLVMIDNIFNVCFAFVAVFTLLFSILLIKKALRIHMKEIQKLSLENNNAQ